jgi:hypothetical protein
LNDRGQIANQDSVHAVRCRLPDGVTIRNEAQESLLLLSPEPHHELRTLAEFAEFRLQQEVWDGSQMRGTDGPFGE